MGTGPSHCRSKGRAGLARWMPGLAALLHYDPAWLPKDLAAGLSVAAIALPVGIAYAELTGVPAAVGIYAAIFPLVPYALFGSSRQLILGPDAATCIMVAASLAPLAQGDPARYLALLPVLTLITGALYVVAGLGRLGFFASFLSQPILTGYLNGIAIVIIVGQLPKLLGYPSEAGEVLPRLLEFVQRLGPVAHADGRAGPGLARRAARVAPPGSRRAGAAGGGGWQASRRWRIRPAASRGVAVTGAVPAGLPVPTWTWFDAGDLPQPARRRRRHRADQLHRRCPDRQELRPTQPLRDRRQSGADGARRGQSRRRPGPGLPGHRRRFAHRGQRRDGRPDPARRHRRRRRHAAGAVAADRPARPGADHGAGGGDPGLGGRTVRHRRAAPAARA